MSSTTITIPKVPGMNYTPWGTKMALCLEQKQVYGIVKSSHDKVEEAAANATATEKAAFNDWMNLHGVPRLTILLVMKQRVDAEYMVVDAAKMLSEKLSLGYHSTLKHNMFKIRENI
jgi:hypothetical protein